MCVSINPNFRLMIKCPVCLLKTQENAASEIQKSHISMQTMGRWRHKCSMFASCKLLSLHSACVVHRSSDVCQYLEKNHQLHRAFTQGFASPVAMVIFVDGTYTRITRRSGQTFSQLFSRKGTKGPFLPSQRMSFCSRTLPWLQRLLRPSSAVIFGVIW